MGGGSSTHVPAGPGNKTLMSDYPYVFYWNRLGRKGKRCKVTARGKLNSCRVGFEDGFVVITSRNAVRNRLVDCDSNTISLPIG